MIEKNGTWELVDRPTEIPVIGVKWVYKTKLNLDGSVQKNKARLVAKGYAQKPGLDYNETYAPVARLNTVRTLIALAAQKEWKLYQLDVKSSFLNGVLPWLLIVSIYVDDIVYTGSCTELLDEFKEEMMMKYEMTDLGLLHHFHGWEWSKQTQAYSFTKRTTEKLVKVDGSGAASEEQYRSIVGNLLYLTATRPNIMYAFSLLARFMHCPTNKHYGTAKRVLSKSTFGYAFSFGRDVFSWALVKQNCVALFTAEAEYISASKATAQAIWLRFVLEDFGELQTEATPLECDNTSAIAITKNPMFH
ncbi:hypothetical protein L3X38_043287 [Prunus dulcis]|uniref:Reverse transcriptase Ty1/copia-type domain-containing protein n=1 Tax=Prunus dulcis TaxID=3755 RepID=A0AAD4UXV5_PRUDU|nr:hypothetical protein L3X38_043287 [Prunus dulcis]